MGGKLDTKDLGTLEDLPLSNMRDITLLNLDPASSLQPPRSPNDPACLNLWQRRLNQLGFGTCLVAVASLA